AGMRFQLAETQLRQRRRPDMPAQGGAALPVAVGPLEKAHFRIEILSDLGVTHGRLVLPLSEFEGCAVGMLAAGRPRRLGSRHKGTDRHGLVDSPFAIDPE